MAEKKLLSNIVIIRILLIFLLVVLHSFTIYGGGWTEPQAFKPVKFYWWIAKFSYSFLLELFVFISGYLFAYQIIELKRIFTYKGIVVGKFKRLIIPSIIFSFFYLLLFPEERSLADFIYKLIVGAGHMWFLPMLFWCFIFGYFVINLKLDDKLKSFLLFCQAVCSFVVPNYFQISKSFYYLFFFYLGFLGSGIQDTGYEASLLQVCIGIITFLSFFIFLTLFKEFISTNWSVSNVFEKTVKGVCVNLCKIIPSMFGCIFIFLLVTNWTKNWKRISLFWISMSSLCFGVYLYQQFILKVLYYKTDLPILVGPIWLPILGCLITLTLSILLSKLTMMTKVGRLLIG